MERRYTVAGHWPFPIDMLRHDNARPATPADQVLIDRLSADSTDNGFGLDRVIRIQLAMDSGEPNRSNPTGRWRPNCARWESFGWQVVMITLTTEQWERIHPDYRGLWTRDDTPEFLAMVGRRTVMSGAIGYPLHYLAIEGIHFEIK